MSTLIETASTILALQQALSRAGASEHTAPFTYDALRQCLTKAEHRFDAELRRIIREEIKSASSVTTTNACQIPMREAKPAKKRKRK